VIFGTNPAYCEWRANLRAAFNALGNGPKQDFPACRAASPSPSLASLAPSRTTKAFLDEYLVSETGEVPFGGRDSELARLDDWLFDPNAAPRMLVTAPVGRGKSALLVHWMKSLCNSPASPKRNRSPRIWRYTR
jgi:hypothetical protein